MRRKTLDLLAVAGVLSALAGCADPNDPAINPKADHALRTGLNLFNGHDRSGWLTVAGRSAVKDGKLVLNPQGGEKAIVASLNLDASDGEVVLEIENTRAEMYENPGPYSISVRVKLRIDWSAVYFVCWPDKVGAYLGSASNPYPEPVEVVDVKPADGSIRWRLVMQEHRIRCYRDGKLVMTVSDPNPRSGTLAITADRSRVKVAKISYRKLPTTAATPTAESN
jgi:hypothetical protein